MSDTKLCVITVLQGFYCVQSLPVVKGRGIVKYVYTFPGAHLEVPAD